MINFPKHDCGMYLEHNTYKNQYMTIEKAVEHIDEDLEARDEWVSEEERQKALDSGDIWELQWYPDTPVGCYCVRGSTLDAVLMACKEDGL